MSGIHPWVTIKYKRIGRIMEMNLWFFLTISVIFTTGFLCMIAVISNKSKMKALEVEELKIKNINLKAEVEAAVSRHINEQNDRIAVLEAIVTDKKYELNEKITNLR